MYDIIVVGGGVAGQTAALYAAIKKMNVMLLTKKLGDSTHGSTGILNYPGMLEIDGLTLTTRMKGQLRSNYVSTLEDEEIKRISLIEGGLRVYSENNAYDGSALIIATGASPCILGVPGEDRLAAKGITYCGICDAQLFQDRDIAVIGDDSAALEAAQSARNTARNIVVISREKGFNAPDSLIEKTLTYPNIKVITEAEILEIHGNDRIESVGYKRSGAIRKLPVSGVVIERGHKPDTGFLKGFVELDDAGYVVINGKGETSVEGVYAAGDCTGVREYQYPIAAGQGCTAILKASRYLANKKA
ncbi:MAG: NAD(P)/FAD-dependent oxidoreductase [Candidatus Altiarchaeia archaeon]